MWTDLYFCPEVQMHPSAVLWLDVCHCAVMLWIWHGYARADRVKVKTFKCRTYFVCYSCKTEAVLLLWESVHLLQVTSFCSVAFLFPSLVQARRTPPSLSPLCLFILFHTYRPKVRTRLTEFIFYDLKKILNIRDAPQKIILLQPIHGIY